VSVKKPPLSGRDRAKALAKPLSREERLMYLEDLRWHGYRVREESSQWWVARREDGLWSDHPRALYRRLRGEAPELVPK